MKSLTSPPSLARAGALTFLVFLSLATQLAAQVGNQNPGGVSGMFNGHVNTGCSYDPYTGNATRSVTDIVVAGAVGEYPLALVRTANSRSPSTTEVFGMAGGWNHNYNWILEDSPSSNTANFHPARYTVDFPDGRVETFRAVTWDTVYRARPGADSPAQSTSAGVRERFLQLNLNNMYAYLFLPDGGAVEFIASQHVTANGRYYYKYHVTGIYDPHGLKTTLQSEVTPNGLRRRLVWVIDPSGQRNLHFTYTGPNNAKIASVEASDGRVVNYYYIYCNGCRLDRVRYYNNPAWDARYQYCNSNVGQGLPPLLWTADDPMYSGAMKRIAYQYKTGNNPDGNAAVYGQILRERYWDGVSGHETSGAFVSELAVGAANPVNHNVRTEKRSDTVTRTFTYNGAGYVTWVTDFMSHSSTYGYDSYKYLNSFIDFKRNETDYTCDPITGNITQIRFPLTPGDTPGQGNTHPTVNYTYTNSYYLHSVRDEGSHTTTFTRDNNNRVTRIDYPDGGYETFGYDAGHFYQPSTHRMTTGGTETFTYDGSSRLQYYSDPYHSNPSNPSIQYFYAGHGWVDGILDALGHPTNFDYNDRGQVTVTTLATDPSDNQRHTITNVYNPDGTLQRKTDQLGHVTSYIYDEYRRLKSVTPPAREGTHTTQFYYGVNPSDNVNDYRFTDSNVTWLVFPSGKKTKTTYDDNRRKSTLTVAPNTPDEATTSYVYDNVGNVRTVTNPRGYLTTTAYDERNRPYSISVPGQTTTLTYDTAGRKKTITRPNGQVITYLSFDPMNRVLTQTAPNMGTTAYTYTPAGLIATMQDPHLYGGGDQYTYAYDAMGRRRNVTYPLDSDNVHRTEVFTYDADGRLETFQNRAGKLQTFTYDTLNRITGFSWNDGGVTPSVTFTYDAASRLTEIDNANATISRTYWNDNLLSGETEDLTAIGGAANRHVLYNYDEDGNLGTLQIPGYSFTYDYTNRNQLKDIKQNNTALATYVYDENGYIGDLTTRTLNNSTNTSYRYDQLDRPTWITHTLNGASRGFNYAYYDNTNNRKYVRRTGSTLGDVGDVLSYDLADQAIGVQLNVSTPQSTPPPAQNVFYDPNGNRTWFNPASEHYAAANDLSQYTTRTIVRTTTTAAYDHKGNMTTGLDGSAYTYDAQNRLLTAHKSGGPTMSFTYDGLNRQVSRTVGNTTTYSLWNGWDLVEEYQPGPVIVARYLYGPTGLVKELQNNRYYYQDGSGNTSHLADSNGNLLEWYRYDLDGTPFSYDSGDHLRSPNQSAFGVRHLFSGQQWYSDIGLYDLRNRFYFPDIGRFLQPDPIRFRGDRTNLYRYCRNNPITKWDPFGLQVPTSEEKGITVYGDPIPRGWAPGGTFGGGYPLGGGPGEPGIGTRGRSDNPSDLAELERVNQALERLSNELSAPPPQNPPSPGDTSTNPATSSSSPTQAQITAGTLQAVVVTFSFGGQYMPMTPVKNNAQARILRRRLLTRVPIFVPPGENPQATNNRWAGTTYPFNLPSFGLAFRFKGPNDFAFNVSPIYDAYGNFSYGYSGWSAGIPPSFLQYSAAAVKGGFNDPVNVYDIELGIDAAMMGGTLSVVPVSDSDF